MTCDTDPRMTQEATSSRERSGRSEGSGLLECPACGHPMSPARAVSGESDATCPECGMVGAEAVHVRRRALRWMTAFVVVASVGRCMHACGLIGPEVGWTSERAERWLLALRSGSYLVAAIACAMAAYAPRRSPAARRCLLGGAVVLLGSGALVLTLGIGARAVSSMPTWFLDLIADPTFGRVTGAVPPSGQWVAIMAISLALWRPSRGWRRLAMAVVFAAAVLFAIFESLLRLQWSVAVLGGALAGLYFEWRIWLRVAVDAMAAIGWLVQCRRTG